MFLCIPVLARADIYLTLARLAGQEADCIFSKLCCQSNGVRLSSHILAFCAHITLLAHPFKPCLWSVSKSTPASELYFCR
jgi:hypothetical protein